MCTELCDQEVRHGLGECWCCDWNLSMALEFEAALEAPNLIRVISH